MSLPLEGEGTLRLFLGTVLVEFLVQLGSLVLYVTALLFDPRAEVGNDSIVTELSRVGPIKVTHLASGRENQSVERET